MSQDTRRRETALRAAALRHANNDTPDSVAIEDLGRIAGEHNDLLTLTASDLMTAWLVDPPQRQARRVKAVWLLLAAGANIATVADDAIAAVGQVRV
jgi:hypothetical protein